MPSDADTVHVSSPSSHTSQRTLKSFLPVDYECPPSQAKDTSALNCMSVNRSLPSSNKDTLPEPMIYQTMQQKIQEWSKEDDECFAVCDLGDVYRQHMRWKRHLPRVEPFYGMYNNFRVQCSKQQLMHAEICSREMQ